MASDGEEDDYMSLKFLEEPEDKKELSYIEKRKKALREQEKKAYIKPRRVLEEEARQEGLQKELDEKNKGMKMLMKMGFKQGMTLGKEAGIAKPIDVEIKSGRGGIGRDSLEKRKREEELEHELAKKPKMDPEEYREQLSACKREAQIQRFTIAAAKICEKLDKDNAIEFNVLWLLNPANLPTIAQEEVEEADHPSTSEPIARDESTTTLENIVNSEIENVETERKLELTEDQKEQLSELQEQSVLDYLWLTKSLKSPY